MSHACPFSFPESLPNPALMRAEAENHIEQVKQAIGLLRRFL
jgi:hypothetical protein